MPLSKIQSGGIDSIAGVAGGSSSNIKEQLAMLCDGQNYVVGSGTYTLSLIHI